MIEAYRVENGRFIPTEDLGGAGVWIDLTAPGEAEIAAVSTATAIPPDLLRAALDEEERPRLEVDPSCTLILIDIPVAARNGLPYDTIPLGLILSAKALVTVCLTPGPLMREFRTHQKNPHPAGRTRLVLQILFAVASRYLKYLKEIDRRSTEIEAKLGRSMKNEELMELLRLGKSLVYFTTSLKADALVVDHLRRWRTARGPEAADPVPGMEPEDEALLEDVVIEMEQAVQMSEIYTNILSGTMDAFASLVSNNLNIVMKFLAAMTIVLALPALVAGFYGMNVALPFQRSPLAFSLIAGFSLALSLAAIVLLKKKGMF